MNRPALAARPDRAHYRPPHSSWSGSLHGRISGACVKRLLPRPGSPPGWRPGAAGSLAEPAGLTPTDGAGHVSQDGAEIRDLGELAGAVLEHRPRVGEVVIGRDGPRALG
jgi:hypothetical protein